MCHGLILVWVSPSSFVGGDHVIEEICNWGFKLDFKNNSRSDRVIEFVFFLARSNSRGSDVAHPRGRGDRGSASSMENLSTVSHTSSAPPSHVHRYAGEGGRVGGLWRLKCREAAIVCILINNFVSKNKHQFLDVNPMIWIILDLFSNNNVH